MEKSNIKNQILKICGLGFFFLILNFLSGCVQVEERAQNMNMLSVISSGELKGMSKVEVIQEFGAPAATSKSELSECWYYAKPKAIWLWFENDQVDHWEVE